MEAPEPEAQAPAVEAVAVREPETPEEIAEFYAAEAPRGTFDVTLPSGRIIKVRYPDGYWEIRDFFRTLVEFWQKWSDPDDLLDELKPYAPQDWSVAYAAYLLHYWSAEPTKYSVKASLRLCRNAWVMDSVKSQIEKKSAQVVKDRAMEEIEEEGKGSTETSS